MNALILISIWSVAISQCVAISPHVALRIPSTRTLPYAEYQEDPLPLPLALRIPPTGAKVVFQWPMALCVFEKCKEIHKPPRFTLHGVWPIAQDGITTMTCDRPDKKFCWSVIKRRRDDEKWISYIGDEYDFLQHEWVKHGSCFELNCADYFQSSLSLWEMKYTHILKALEKNGIVPSIDKLHRIESFYNAIVNNLNLRPMIFCKSLRNGRRYVVEIVLCATKELNDFRNCPGSPEYHMTQTQCGGRFSQALFYRNPKALDIKLRSSQINTTATT